MQRRTSGLAVWRSTAIALTIVVVSWAAACSDDDDDDDLTTATSCEEAAGSEDEQGADPDDPGSFVIADIRHEVVEPGCERIIVDLDPDDETADLAYSVSYRQGPLAGPSGTIDVDGESILEIVLHQTSVRGQDLGAFEPAADSQIVVDIVPLPEVPGGSIWAFGVAEQSPFAVSVERGSPSQLIVTLTRSAGADSSEDDAGALAAETRTRDDGDQECDHEAYDGDHVLAVLGSDGRFDYLLCVIESGADAVRYFTTGDRRLFAPTDDVFADLGGEALAELVTGASGASNRFGVAMEIGGESVQARALLDHHVLGCSPNSAAPSCPSPPEEEELQTGHYRNAAGATIAVDAGRSEVRAGQAVVIDRLRAANGVIYVVDGFVSLP